MKPFVWRARAALAGLLLFLSAPPTRAQAPDCQGDATPQRLYLDVEGVRSADGFVVATVYGPERRRFLKRNGELLSVKEPAQPPTTTICLYLPSSGLYAFVAFHDANADGKLNVGPFGPLEGYGFSNNVHPIFSAPSLKSTQVQIDPGDTHLQIRLRYPP